MQFCSVTWVASVALVVMGLPLTGCASSRGNDGGPSDLSIIGDEKGGTIPRSIGGAANTQSSAYEMVTAHCAKFGKKGFITRMDFESGTMAFSCILRKAKP